MARVHEIVARVRAEGQSQYVSDVREGADETEKFADTTEQSTERAGVAWENVANVTGAALTAAGGALEAYNRKMQTSQDVAARTANAIDAPQKAVMDAASEVNSAATSMDEVTQLMQLGSQRGLESIPALQDWANTWIEVANATGEPATELAQMSQALQQVGISAQNPKEAMAAFGFVAENTQASVVGLMEFVQELGTELGDQAPSIEQATALMKAAQEGFPEMEEAQSQVAEALRQTNGDLEAAREQLGITESAMARYEQQVASSSGVIESNASAVRDNRTTLQELSSDLESAMARYSGLGQAAEVASPVLMGAGGALLIVNQAVSLLRSSTVAATAANVAHRVAMVATHPVYYAQAAAAAVATAASWAYSAGVGAASAATWALNGALAVLTSPITLVIAAIGAAVAAGWYLYNNWDEVTAWVKEAWSSVADFLSGVWDGIVDTFKRGVNAAIGPINSLIDAFNAVQITLPTIPDWVPVVGGKGGQTIGFDIGNIPTFDMSSDGPGRPSVGANSATPSSAAQISRNVGGPVPGDGPDRDSILTALTPGEWVLSRRAVEGLGEETLAAIEQFGRRARGGDGLSAADVLFGGDAAGPGILHRNIGGAVDFARSEAGDPYVWGGVGPHGYDCSGFTSALTNVAMGQQPHQRRHTTATVSSDPAYARGLQSGLMLGVSSAAQLGGIGHMAATVAGMPAESRGSAGVLAGTAARGAGHSLFNQQYGHRGFAGEQGPLADPQGGGSNIPFWARPVLDAIANAFGGAFGLPEEGWAEGRVHDRPWRGIANVAERETEVTSPVSLLDDRIDAGLARHDADGGGRRVVIEEGAIQVTEARSPKETADAVLAELEDRLAW